MSISKTLYGSTRVIPETGESDWGGEVTGILDDLIDGAEGTTFLISGVPVPYVNYALTTLADGATLTATRPMHGVSGTSAPVVLSVATAITSGGHDGQELRLVGKSNTNTVTIRNGANTIMNGDWIGGLGDMISFVWDVGESDWIEQWRNN